ncbi:uncharacterized protein LOC126668603 [Mercurialis annua]|uniref:uncharacterized protein LOC126668603 n=1 Tax=Mercurialis annua TaxID=3986 RepID=UPI00215F34AF|nr:uncharacterized protein LOC126668603 [Mercurialis annua]
MKHIWDLVAIKKSTWALWVIRNKLKLLSFWGITKPFNASWNWRSLINLRDEVKSCYCYNLGKGDIMFWHDPWVDGCSLLELYPNMVIEDIDVPYTAKVKDLWRRGRWNLPNPMDEVTAEAWERVRKFSVNSMEDLVVWKHSKNGAFSIQNAWKTFRPATGKVSWWRLIWSPGLVPRHSFIVWLAIKKKLRTKDKLRRWGCVGNDICVLCGEETETIEHLFFSCQVSAIIFQKVLQACLINRNVLVWRRECSWFSRRAAGKSLMARLRRVAFACSVYYVRKGTNISVFEEEAVNVAMILSWIRRDMLLKMYSRRDNSHRFMLVYEN